MKRSIHPTRLRFARRGSSGGFTLVEIIICFIILGILTLIMVPAISGRSEDAKVAGVNEDLKNLADAEERAAVDIGYLVRPYVLNDGFSGLGIPRTPKGLNVLYLQQDNMFISLATLDYVPIGAQQALRQQLTSGTRSAIVKWNGPYVNWQRDVNINDWPDDPWGNDYLLFTSEGVIYPADSASPVIEMRTDHSGVFQTTGPIGGPYSSLDTTLFDRPTWVSLGANGVPGDGTGIVPGGDYGQGDDFVRQFGGPRTLPSGP